MGKKKIAQKTQEVPKEPVAHPKGATANKAESGSGSKLRLENGRIYVHASYNNTMVTVTDPQGKVVAWLSAGSLGFSGPKKATPFAASKVAEAIVEKVRRSGPVNVDVFVNGVGRGRDSAVRSLAARGFNILSIRDVTPVPHNGPRPRKVRRV